MSAAPVFIICIVERKLIGVTPVQNRHEMREYQCPQCNSMFRLVAERQRGELPEMKTA